MSRSLLPANLMLWLERLLAAIFLGGQVLIHVIYRPIHRRNTLDQMAAVGPQSVVIALVTALAVAMVFTIQVSREFINFGATSVIGGILALTLSRELSPVLTAVVLAGRVGSAFAAEIGTMRVTEQIDALEMLKSDPVDYLVIPRVIACALMMPLLNVLAFFTGMIGGWLVATSLYDVPSVVFITSARNFLTIWDLASSLIKSVIFGLLIAVIGCSWGLTTTGGAKGVGQSTTTAVVTSLLAIFVSNFFLSWVMFQGAGSALSGQ